MAEEKKSGKSMKQRAELEFEKLGVIALYLFLTLTALGIYKRYVLRGFEVFNFKLGYNAVEALILGKVILIGDLMHLGKGFNGYPAAVPTAVKALLFSVLAAIFSVLEVFVEKIFHDGDADAAWRDVVALDRGHLAVETVVAFLLFIPLFAMWEIAGDMGEENLIKRFFANPPKA